MLIRHGNPAAIRRALAAVIGESDRRPDELTVADIASAFNLTYAQARAAIDNAVRHGLLVVRRIRIQPRTGGPRKLTCLYSVPPPKPKPKPRPRPKPKPHPKPRPKPRPKPKSA